METNTNINLPGKASFQMKVLNYTLYLSRQSYYQDGYFREINGIITINFNEISILNKKANKAVISFLSKGCLKPKYLYDSNDKSFIFEYPSDDLQAWISTLIHPNEKRLDFEAFDAEDYLKIYLYLSGK